MKTCTVCGQEKQETDFYIRRRRGKVELHSKCKECTKADQKDYHHNRGGKNIQKEYRKTEAGKEARKKADKRYTQSEGGKLARRSYQMTLRKGRGKHIQLTPEQRKMQRQARNFIGGEVRNGRMKSAKEFLCNNCPKQAKEYHHYLGYEKEHWSDVVPMCVKCHRHADIKPPLSDEGVSDH